LFRAGDYRIFRPEAGCGGAHKDDGKAAPVLVNHLVDLTELVIGANLSGGSFHRGNEIRAIFFFAHLAFCGVLGFDFGDTSLHTAFSHEFPATRIGVSSLTNPAISFGKGHTTRDILSKLLISDALENWHSCFLPEPFFGFAMPEGCLNGRLMADFAAG
jgi:hypothetical protein